MHTKINNYIMSLNSLCISLEELIEHTDKLLKDNSICEKLTKGELAKLQKNSKLLSTSLNSYYKLSKKANDLLYVEIPTEKPKEPCKFYVFPLINDIDIEVDKDFRYTDYLE